MKTSTALAAAKALALVLLASPAVAAPAAPQPPAGVYILDKTHTSVSFRVNHLGFSHYTARFSSIDGRLKFDPAAPAAMSVDAAIDPLSLELNAPPKGFHDELTGKAWFNAAAFPAITFHSTKVEVTGANTARLTGDLSLHGVTKPVTLEVTYNGGWPPNSFDPGGARIGFSAHGMFKRSAFGMGMGVPAPGSTMGVGDEVEVMIETEFSSKVPPAAK